MINQKILIKQAKKGNAKAQMHLYDLYCDAMYYSACRYLPKEEAKDAMQEGFLSAFVKLDSYKKDVNFGLWLKKIIIHKCLDILRKKTIITEQIDETTLKIVDDENWLFEETITKKEVLEAIDKLSEKYKIVVKLYLLEGYDHVEISEIINIPVKTSRVRLRRGKLQLQTLLKKENYEARY